jgi:hypothetical protein
MNTAANDFDFLAALFAGETRTAAEIEADMNAARAVEAARIAAVKAALAAPKAKPANACPRCSGSGYLPQFQHRKGGECFACGATGVFARYAA